MGRVPFRWLGVGLVLILGNALVAQEHLTTRQVVERWAEQSRWKQHAQWKLELTYTEQTPNFSRETQEHRTCLTGPAGRAVICRSRVSFSEDQESSVSTETEERHIWTTGRFYHFHRWLSSGQGSPRSWMTVIAGGPRLQQAEYLMSLPDLMADYMDGASFMDPLSLPQALLAAEDLTIVRQERIGSWETFVLRGNCRTERRVPPALLAGSEVEGPLYSQGQHQIMAWLLVEPGRVSAVRWMVESQFSWSRPTPDGRREPVLEKVIIRMTQRWEARQFDIFGTLFVPVAGTYQREYKTAEGQRHQLQVNHVRRKILALNPALSPEDFLKDIPDGTPVDYLEGPNDAHRCCHWRDGQIIAGPPEPPPPPP